MRIDAGSKNKIDDGSKNKTDDGSKNKIDDGSKIEKDVCLYGNTGYSTCIKSVW